MASNIILSLALSLLLSLAGYYVTSSLYAAVGILVVGFAIFLFAVCPLLEDYGKRKRRRSECASFISSFILSLSATNSIEKAFESALANCSKEGLKLAEGLLDLSAEEKVAYFQSYFDDSIYPMFVSVFRIYLEQGGDILSLCSTVEEESTRIVESDAFYHQNGVRLFTQFALMWGLSLLVMVFMRLSLSSLNAYLSESPSFLIAGVAYFALLLCSVLVYAYRFSEGKLSSIKIAKRRKGK